ncbi:unnamed protein product [Choristocarpus tenellus]|uniref:putative plastid-specific 30S ribosomal protein n=1 Tax=Choristocarpus tenellus TaxID=116065 RepID=UPI002E76EECC|nr:putative plastid-specific 30S ribosomal protein [Choristocarpus tenellus]WAM62295.1 putative plastid-specific 30S ribosomal protein [Choristocarpus tenellus]
MKNNYSFKIIWSKNYLGLAVNQKQKNISIPITSFFFWPRENGWELLKAELFNKPWMLKEDCIEILNNYTILINYWLINSNKIEGITKLVQDSSKLNFELIASI